MKWRAVAYAAYYPLLALCGAALVYFFPPHFDLTPSLLIGVGIVALFLLVIERPTKAAGVALVPLTALMAASTVVFGYWAILLAACAWAGILFRLGRGTSPVWRIFRAWAGHVGWSIASIYAMVHVWQFSSRLAAEEVRVVATLINIGGIVACGMVWQTINNLCVYPSYTLVGERPPGTNLVKVGLIASAYAYLLVALYQFGGIIAAALFYVVVGQERMVQGVLGLTRQLQELHRARSQARQLVSELVRLSDVDQSRFSDEVQMLAQRIATKLHLPREEVAKIGLAAELHEIGKARLAARGRANGDGAAGDAAAASSSDTDRDRSEPMTPVLAELRTYPRAGAIMVRQADALLPSEIAYWIECHDEHFDGTGYPRGLAGDDIPLPSRIIAVAREYVRLTIGLNGAYAAQKPAALAHLRERSGTYFDPAIVGLLEEAVA